MQIIGQSKHLSRENAAVSSELDTDDELRVCCDMLVWQLEETERDRRMWHLYISVAGVNNNTLLKSNGPYENHLDEFWF